MSDNIPFDIQTEIIRRLPPKSLLRFQCVSKLWNSLINSTKFINDHQRINKKQCQCHLLVRHNLHGQVAEYTSIIDDDTFPSQKSSVTLPPPLDLMNDRYLENLCSVNGVLCFCGYHRELKTGMIVLWNPSIRKTIGIPIPPRLKNDVFGLGFCRDSSDLKLVKIEGTRGGSYWKVDVFTLSSCVWKTVFNGWSPIDGCVLEKNHVFIDGYIYWLASYYSGDLDCENPNVIISFDLKTEEFGQVSLPDRLLQVDTVEVAEVNESLGVLEIYDDCDDDVTLCVVWVMEFVTKSFVKMFSVKIPDEQLHNGVFWLRNLEPLSGRINHVGINGVYWDQRVSSYKETLLLLDQAGLLIFDGVVRSVLRCVFIGRVIIELDDGIKSLVLKFRYPRQDLSRVLGSIKSSGKQHVSLYMETLLLLDQTVRSVILCDDVERYNYQSGLD